MTVPVSSSNADYYGGADISYSGPGAAQWQSAALDLILEYVPDLWWPQAGEVFNRMRNDAQIGGSLKAWTLPIRRAYWSLDTAGCRPTVYRRIADDLGLPLLGQPPKPSGARRRRVVWSEHLRASLRSRAIFGHAPFAQAYDTTSGVARLDNLQERLPKSIYRILVDETTGDIDYVEQNRWSGQPQLPTIQRNGLVWYVNDREGIGWRGRSLMRESYPYWLIKNEMLRVHAASNRRWGTGIPTAQALPGTNPTPEQMLEADRVVRNYRASETGGATMPAGFRLAVEGITGNVPDTLSFIKYLDGQMSLSFLTQWLNLGTTDHGARSLAETFVDMFHESIQDFGDSHADQATSEIVVPLVNTNSGEDEPAPPIVCGNVGANHTLTAAVISDLYTCGALSGDPELESAIRQMYKLPQRDPDAPVVVPGADVPKPELKVVAAAAGDPMTGAFVIGMLSAADAERLVQPDGEPAAAMHVTLGYLAQPADQYDDDTRAAFEAALTDAAGSMPVSAAAFATATLNAENEPTDDRPPCAVLLVQSPELAALHDAVDAAVEATDGVEDGSFPTWFPHVTLGYGLDAADLPTGLLGPLTFDRLVVGWGDETHDLTNGDAA